MNNILESLYNQLGEKVLKTSSVGGGCIAQSGIIYTDKGNKYFLKQGFSNGMFKCEANGLKELAKADCIRIPNVILIGEDFLILEVIESGVKTSHSMAQFGCQLAKLHRYNFDKYGFKEDNFIGASVQKNTFSNNWSEFYFNNRIFYQYNLVKANGKATSELTNLISKLENKIYDILKDSENFSSLLHGDLWGGNYMIDDKGNAVLVDPAVYYGNREADLAMTKLFGGFSSDFYEGYRNEFPLAAGYEYRENIYSLYHVMNHYNLFGDSYYRQMIDLIKFYL